MIAPVQDCACGTCTRRRFYFVSVIRDDGATAMVCGPYPTHSEALAQVVAARDAAYALDPTTWWLAWGTCGSDEPVAARWANAEAIR